MGNFTFNETLLANYLEVNIPGFRGPLRAEKFSGGQSNPTFLISTADSRYVLRKKPPGELLKSAHAVDREYRVISALNNSNVPVPRVYHLCEDDTIIGSMFYVMEYIDGQVLWDPALPEIAPEKRADIYQEMSRVLAALHSVDPEAVGLKDYGKPGGYFQRQTGRWTQQYKATETESIEDMDFLIDWLPKNMPKDDGRVSLVHGDFRLDNMMFAHEESKVLALVDWELSTLGHPYADIAYQCMQLRMPHDSAMAGLGGLNRSSLCIPSEEEYVAQYCENMKMDKIPNWNFYLAFSFFRFTAILQGVKKRAMEGNASNKKAMELGELTKPLSAMAVELC